MTERNPRHYWGIKAQSRTIFTGTHEQCWNQLMDQYKDYSVAELVTLNIRIARIK